MGENMKKSETIPSGVMIAEMAVSLSEESIRDLRKALKRLRRGKIEVVKLQMPGDGDHDAHTILLTHDRMFEGV